MKLTIATPSHDGRVCAPTAGAVAMATGMLARAGHSVAWEILAGCSLVHRARNELQARFLASDSERILWIDQDIATNPRDVVTMLLEPGADFVGGIYAKKQHAPRIAVLEILQGAPNKEGNRLEVSRIGTGFLSVSRMAVEKMVAMHTADTCRNDAGVIIPALFDLAIVAGSDLSEDWRFCDRWRATGGKVWARTDIVLGHIGTFTHWSDR